MEKTVIRSKKFILISEVISDFNFEMVEDYMRAVEWTWAVPYSKEGKIPNIKELKITAEDLLCNVLFNNSGLDEYWISTGGFKAYKDNKTHELWLEFELKK